MERTVSASSVRPIDRFIAARLRDRRVAMGLSLKQAAELVGSTHHQMFKYETAVNRLSAGRLYEIAHVLGTPIDWFFEDLEHAEPPDEIDRPSRRLLDLIRLFELMSDRDREALLSFTELLVAGGAMPEGSLK